MPDGTKAARITFVAGEKKPNKISAGIRFDNEVMLALQSNITFPVRKRLPMQLSSNYILLRLAATKDGDTYSEMFKKKTMIGSSLSYYYNSPIGPIGLSLGYSNVTEKLYYYFNLGYVF